MPPVKRRPRRRIGRPPMRRINQPGGQFGILAPILKVVAPLVATELARFGIQKGLKKLTGRGMRGNGLALAGQRRGRGPGRAKGSAAMRARMAAVRAQRKPTRRRAPAGRRRGPSKRRVQILPFPLPPGLKL